MKKELTIYDKINHLFIVLYREYERTIKDKSPFSEGFENKLKNKIYNEYEEFIKEYPNEMEKVNGYFLKECHQIVLGINATKSYYDLEGFIDDQIKLFEEIYSTMQGKCKEKQKQIESYQSTGGASLQKSALLQESTSESDTPRRIESDTSNTSQSIVETIRSSDSGGHSRSKSTKSLVDYGLMK